MNQLSPNAFDEFEHLHDWRESQMVSYEQMDKAQELLGLIDQLQACHTACEKLMLHVCSRFKSDEMLNLAVAAESEAALAIAQTQHFARHY